MNHPAVIGTLRSLAILALVLTTAMTGRAAEPAPTRWEWCGWGGGGFFWAAAYHPTKPGVIYMGGDVAGMYKTEDDGKNWRMINNGLIDYGVYGLAVDPKTPDTVYAITESGTCKSTDAGEHWTFLPETGKGKLGILADRHVSVRPMAVDPSDSNIVYAATPHGRIFKSEDGAGSWKELYQLRSSDEVPADALRVELADGPPYFGGIFFAVKPPADAAIQGFGVSFKGNGIVPRTAFITLMGPDGSVYRSKSLAEMLEKTDWQDLVLSVDDFVIDPDHAKQKADKAANWPKQVDFKTVHRMDFACSGNPKPLVVLFRSFYIALSEGKRSIVREFATDKKVNSYGGFKVDGPKAGSFASISVAQKDPRIVLAASLQAGAFISKDAGKSWESMNTPKSAQCVVADPKDTSILYGAFGTQGVFKSVDGGKTWAAINTGIKKDVKILEIAVSPGNSQELICIGEVDWNGYSYWSDNGGQTWNASAKLKMDRSANPTWGMDNLSRPTNVTYCPSDPKKLYVSSNWRPAFSDDGGRGWTERDRGADISCVFDVRFSKNRVYTASMDEGVLFTEDNGKQWQNAWPNEKGGGKISGHYWRLAISNEGGVDRIVSTCSPWNAGETNRIVLSEDGAKSFKIITGSGLLSYKPAGNTMWGQSYPRAMAVDPKDPRTIYMGMDGDPESGKPGGGIFKSTDGGYTWKQLPNQPGSRRMFFGLAVDPTDSKRIFWGACGNGGGLWRSEDGGDSWKLVFKNETWIFNVLVAADGTVYAPCMNMWRSTDHGNTWKKLTSHTEGQIIGLEAHPTDPKTLWYSTIKHGGTNWGHIMKTTDAGATWTDITGDIGFRKPVVLRFNPATNELWAAGVGVFKTRQ